MTMVNIAWGSLKLTISLPLSQPMSVQLANTVVALALLSLIQLINCICCQVTQGAKASATFYWSETITMLYLSNERGLQLFTKAHNSYIVILRSSAKCCLLRQNSVHTIVTLHSSLLAMTAVISPCYLFYPILLNHEGLTTTHDFNTITLFN